MTDVLTESQRKYCMSRIRAQNTSPEINLRKELWANGFRYRIRNKLPGKPDIIFSKHRIAIFVDGCFWHGCSEHYQIPETNTEFWNNKIEKNVERDRKNNSNLRNMGWIVIRFWEHELKNNMSDCINNIRTILMNEK